MKDEVKAWYYDLKTMADKIDSNSRRHERGNRRIVALSCFVLFAFLVLAYRTEIIANNIENNGDRISKNAKRIIDTQMASCLSNRKIIIEFNKAQDRFIKLDRENPVPGAERLQAIRVRLLQQNKIPVPECPKLEE